MKISELHALLSGVNLETEGDKNVVVFDKDNDVTCEINNGEINDNGQLILNMGGEFVETSEEESEEE